MSTLTRIGPADPLFSQAYLALARPGRFTDEPQNILAVVTETATEYRIRAEIPGARKEGIDFALDEHFVSIIAELGPGPGASGASGASDASDASDAFNAPGAKGGSVCASRGLHLAQPIRRRAFVAKVEDGLLLLRLIKRKPAARRR